MKPINDIFISKNFSVMIIGQGFSKLADNLFYVALVSHVYALTKSTTSIGILMSISIVPVILLGPMAGVFIDRWSKKNIIVIGDIIRGLLLVFMVLFPTIGAVYIITILLSLVDMVTKPALSASIPEVVEEDKILQGNSVINSLESLIVVFAPALSGIIVSNFGSTPIFLLNAVFFTVAGIVMRYVSFSKPAHNVSELDCSVKTAFRQGIFFILKNRVVKFLIGAFMLLTTSIGILNVLSLVYFENIINLGVKGYGFFESAWGVGMFVGAITVTKLVSIYGHVNLFVVGLLIVGIAILLMILIPFFPLVLLFGFIIGLGNIICAVLSATILQEVVPQKFRGRVFSIRQSILQLTSVLSMGLAGILSEVVGLKPVLGGAGLIPIIGCICYAVLLIIFKKLEGKKNDGDSRCDIS